MMFDLVTIHNNEMDRLHYLKSALSELTKLGDGQIQIRFSEAMPIAEPSNFDLLYRHIKLILIRTRLHLSLLKLAKRKKTKKDFVTFAQILRMDKMKTSKAIAEIDVTSKHQWAWKTFLESDLDYLIVLESDAKIRSGIELVSFINNINKFSESDFISLSFPLDFNEIGIPRSLISTKSQYVEVGVQITNTAAGYVLSRKLAQELYHRSRRQNRNRQIVIDWLMNECFMQLNQPRKDFGKTVLPLQELVINGSLTGEYESKLQN